MHENTGLQKLKRNASPKIDESLGQFVQSNLQKSLSQKHIQSHSKQSDDRWARHCRLGFRPCFPWNLAFGGKKCPRILELESKLCLS